MLKMRSVLLGLLLALASPLAAFAQCGTQAPANTFCGNATGSQALAGFRPFSSLPLPTIAGGTVVGNRTTSGAVGQALTNPILGIPGTSTGELGLAGATSGTVTIKPAAAAGTYNFNLPTTAGTTGDLLTSAGGGASAMTFTAPSSVVQTGLGWYIVGSASYPTIQSAITAASAAGSGVVWVPCGNYSIGTAASAVTGIDAQNTENVRVLGPGGRNGGAGQCVFIDYLGTGSAVKYGGSIGFEWGNLYLRGLTAAVLMDGTTGALTSTTYTYVHDNFFQGQNGVTVLNDIASSVNFTAERNAYTGGSVGIRGITSGGGIPAGQYAVNSVINNNSFQPSVTTSGIQGLETATVSNNSFQGQMTGYTSGPATTCHRVGWTGNWHGDAVTPEPLIFSNCNYFSTSNNDFNAGGAAAITQTNSTGVVSSDADRFLGASPWVDIGTGNTLILNGMTISDTPEVTGTPVYSAVPVASFFGSVTFGGAATSPGVPVAIQSQGSGISPRALQINASDFGTNGGMLRINKDPGVSGAARIFSGGTATVDGITIDSGLLTLGLAGTSLGRLDILGSTSGNVSIRPQAAAGTFNFNLPTTAGTSGDFLRSGGGGAAAMTWLTPASGIATWMGTPSSANLAAAVTDEQGSGSLVFNNSPVLVTPNLGTPTALVLTNATYTASGTTTTTAACTGGGSVTSGSTISWIFKVYGKLVWAQASFNATHTCVTSVSMPLPTGVSTARMNQSLIGQAGNQGLSTRGWIATGATTAECTVSTANPCTSATAMNMNGWYEIN